MSIGKYRIFLKTIELGSLSKVAETMGYTQSAVTQKIKGLENEFGFQLIVRNKSGVSLTENGKLVLTYIKNVIQKENELENIVSGINGLEKGTIRIGTFASVAVQWLPKLIRIFQEKYPDIQILLRDGADYNEIEQWLIEDKVDIGFLGLKKDLRVEYEPLVRDSMKAVLPLDYPIGKAESFPIEKFSVENFIFPHTGYDTDVKEVLEKSGIVPNIKYKVSGDETIVAMVKNHLGLAILPNLYVKAHRMNVLTKELNPPFYRTIFLAYSNSKTNRNLSDLFCEYLKKWLKENYEETLFD